MFRPHAFSHLPQLCASALLVVLATSSAGAEVPAEADKAMQREANFKAGFVNGCMKSRDRRGVDERYTRAFCVCAMLQFRAAMSEAEFQQILDRLSNSAPARVVTVSSNAHAQGRIDLRRPPGPGVL